MEKLVLTLLFATACFAQLPPDGGNYNRRPARPPINEPPVQERAYLDEYDYDQNSRSSDDDDDGGNAPYDTIGRTDTRPGKNAPIRQGPPLQGLLSFGDDSVDCKRKYRTLPHEKYCDVYYEQSGCEGQIEKSQAILRACPNGLVYTGNGRNGLIGVCDYPHRAECSGKERHNPPQSTEHCDWLYGIFGHETSCTRYWTCWNGTATEQFCIGGLLYNEETHSCDWPQNVGGCQKHPLCKDDANGNVPLGKSCNRYWACQGGYPRLQRCPAMLVFDKTRKRCVSPPTEDCDIPPPTAQTEDEEQQGGNGGNGGDGDDEQGPPPPPRAQAADKRRFQNQPGPQPFRPDGPRPAGGQALPPLPPNFDLPEGAEPLN